MLKDSNNEILKGVAARIIIAVGFLDTGETGKAIDELQRLVSILPEPSKNNLDAAMIKLSGLS